MTNEDLEDLPGLVRAELTRLRAEKEVFCYEREELRTQLAQTQADLDRVNQEHSDQWQQELASVSAQNLEANAIITDLKAEVQALNHTITTARAERDAIRTELKATRENRDKLRLLLLETQISGASSALDTPRLPAQLSLREQPQSEVDVAELKSQLQHMTEELAATHRTVSWRVTAPLRAVRRKIK